MIKRTLYHFHFCCGLGGGAAGFNRARPRVGNVEAEWVCLGGIDVDPAGLRDFERLAGVPGTLLDLFTRDQYVRFHGKEPPTGWREATPEDVRRAAQGKRPDAVFISSPCKGASGLLSEKLSLTPKYQALNELTLRCIWLMGEAWADDPVPLIVFENVPRLASRGRHLLDQINSLLGGFGYAVAETTHDCGELGGLAQSRKRFLLVARHVEKVPPFLYEPEKKSLRAVGDILGRMPLPGDIEAAGPMHRVPSLQWKTWVRLALVRAGSDWRSLNDLAVEDGYLRDLIIVPEYHRRPLRRGGLRPVRRRSVGQRQARQWPVERCRAAHAGGERPADLHHPQPGRHLAQALHHPGVGRAAEPGRPRRAVDPRRSERQRLARAHRQRRAAGRRRGHRRRDGHHPAAGRAGRDVHAQQYADLGAPGCGGAERRATGGEPVNTEQFIRDSAARGLSRRATRLALGIGPWVFREMLTLMPDIEWPAKGQSLDHKRANSQKQGYCTPALARALDQARQARKEKHTHTVRGRTGTLEELVDLLPSPVSASTVRRRLAAGMSLEDALLTPHLPPKPGHRPLQQVQP